MHVFLRLKTNIVIVVYDWSEVAGGASCERLAPPVSLWAPYQRFPRRNASEIPSRAHRGFSICRRYCG